jgi:RNA polymerase sigma-70 factor (ECF subfamily)
MSPDACAEFYDRAFDEVYRYLALVWATGHHTDDDQLDDLDRESPQRVVELLRGLSSAHRLVLALRYVDELTVEEIANLLGRSVRATESLLVRARRALTSSQRSEA